MLRVLDEVLGPPQITVKDIADQLYIIMRNDPDPMRASRAVGSLYGQVFRRKEAALNPWTPPEGYVDVGRHGAQVL
jgi:hypothetical protein